MGRKQQCDAASQVFVGGTLLVNNNGQLYSKLGLQLRKR